LITPVKKKDKTPAPPGNSRRVWETGRRRGKLKVGKGEKLKEGERCRVGSLGLC